jgi:HAMP domain-containing protein
VSAIEESRSKIFVANSFVILVTALLGFFTFRRIVLPVRALETSVKKIAAGGYTQNVPFTKAKDEIGDLAHSIDVLKQGGVAGFYLFEESSGRLRRLSTYGLAEAAASVESFGLAGGLVGQCAQDRKSISLDHLPPNYLQIASGLGGAAPTQVLVSPLLSRNTLLGVIEIANFHAFNLQEKALLEELLPVVSMSLEILLPVECL